MKLLSFPDGKADDEKTISASSQDDERIISSIFPNPATEKVNFYFPTKEIEADQWISIYSASGRKIKELELQSGTATWNTSNVTPGIYFYRVFNSNQLTTQGKVIIKHP